MALAALELRCCARCGTRLRRRPDERDYKWICRVYCDNACRLAAQGAREHRALQARGIGSWDRRVGLAARRRDRRQA